MKVRGSSPLVAGLVLGLLAMWFAAAPVGASGELVTGGWNWCYVSGDAVACSGGECSKCMGVSVESCSSSIYGCWGGSISVVSCWSNSPLTTHGTGTAGCIGDWPCEIIQNGDCYN